MPKQNNFFFFLIKLLVETGIFTVNSRGIQLKHLYFCVLITLYGNVQLYCKEWIIALVYTEV